MTLEEICTHLQRVEGRGNQRSALCPAHEDKHQSLSISTGPDGKILLHCHCGCSVKDIVEAMGLTMQDLFPEPLKQTPKKKARKLAAQYNYTDIDGNFLNQKTRWETEDGKTFTWSHKENGRWVKGHQGEPVLYNLPATKADFLYIAEGEKDVDTLTALGFPAACGAHGAGPGKWLPQYTKALEGKSVAIFQDNDDAGKAFALETARSLHGSAKSVKLLDLCRVWPEIPNHGDITDMLEALGRDTGKNALVQLTEETPEFSPADWPEPETGMAEPEKEMKDKRISIGIVQKALDTLGISLRYNLLLKEADISGLPECYSAENAVSVLPVYLSDYLKSCGVKGVTVSNIKDCLTCIQDQNRYNPVLEMLESGKWDGQDRIQWLYEILGVSDSKYKVYIRKWLIQCVALALNELDRPIRAEGVLVLQGEQGLAKTSFFRMLSPFPRWFVEGQVIDLSNKDTLIQSLSGWICELGELDSTLKREQSALKAFITSPEDRIRIPYAPAATRAARRTSFCGTVNQKDYLRDETGSRRFWTIPVTHIDKRALFSIPRPWVIQLWFQIYELYKQNPNGFRLSDAEMKELQEDNLEFSVPLPYEIEIREMLDFSLPFDRWEWWKSSEIKTRLGGGDAKAIGKALSNIVSTFSILPSFTPSTHFIKTVNGFTKYFLPLKRWSE